MTLIRMPNQVRANSDEYGTRARVEELLAREQVVVLLAWKPGQTTMSKAEIKSADSPALAPAPASAPPVAHYIFAQNPARHLSALALLFLSLYPCLCLCLGPLAADPHLMDPLVSGLPFRRRRHHLSFLTGAVKKRAGRGFTGSQPAGPFARAVSVERRQFFG